MSYEFSATLQIIGVNPFVTVPEEILQKIFAAAGRDSGPIPIKGQINSLNYTQTLVKYRGYWRLYVNTRMLPKSPQRVGEKLQITIAFDEADRSLALHTKLAASLRSNPSAAEVFAKLPPSRRHEINRYICNLKSEAKVDENVLRAINFLLGKARFVGRDRP